jgi:hypothetical protein
MAARRTVIPFPDYERIYNVTFSVLDKHAHTAHACVFFALIGAAILEDNYKVKASPMAGAAAYLANAHRDPPHLCLFGKFENEQLISTTDAFHCWIESDGIIIDFMAPLFTDSFASVPGAPAVPRRMFQKPKAEMANTLSELRANGDFLLLPNPVLSKQLFQSFVGRPQSVDLLEICRAWYAKPPKRLRDMEMRSNKGDVHPLKLKAPTITGIW